MQNKTIINFVCSTEKKSEYTAACKDLGISISEVCRRALDNTVTLSEKLKTPASSKEKACSVCGHSLVHHYPENMGRSRQTPPTIKDRCEQCSEEGKSCGGFAP